MKHWTAADDAHLLDGALKAADAQPHPRDIPFDQLATDLGRSKKAVLVRWYKLTKNLNPIEIRNLRDKLNSSPAQASHAETA